MSTSAQITLGTIIKVGDSGSPEVFTAIPDVTGLDGPSASKDEKEVTDLSSTGREFLPLVVDPGEISMTLNFRSDNTVHQGLWTDFASTTPVVRNWQLIDTSTVPKTMAFSGFLKGFKLSHPVNDIRTADVTIRLSGLPTFS